MGFQSIFAWKLHCPQIKFVEADALQAETLPPALDGIDVAYYLIHSMSGQVEGFELRDRQAAHNFAVAAKECGVRRVIYLGGLAVTGATVSAHLKSRHETGAVLRKFGSTPATPAHKSLHVVVTLVGCSGIATTAAEREQQEREEQWPGTKLPAAHPYAAQHC